MFASSVDASSSWRYDQHGRNIDIDICVHCDSPIPGPPGPQGPPRPPGTDSNMKGKGVILTDTPAGHERGWDPNGVPGEFFPIEGRIAFAITDPNVTYDKSVVITNAFTVRDEFPLICTTENVVAGSFDVKCAGSDPPEGSELHYLIIDTEMERIE